MAFELIGVGTPNPLDELEQFMVRVKEHCKLEFVDDDDDLLYKDLAFAKACIFAALLHEPETYSKPCSSPANRRTRQISFKGITLYFFVPSLTHDEVMFGTNPVFILDFSDPDAEYRSDTFQIEDQKRDANGDIRVRISPI